MLLQGRSCVSDFVEGVSLLFCDIKGFTDISSSVQPTAIVALLHRLFTGFDILTDKYKVELVGGGGVGGGGRGLGGLQDWVGWWNVWQEAVLSA